MRLDKKSREEYLGIIKEDMPKTKHLATCIRAFVLGGFICCIGQGISDLLGLIKYLSAESIAGYTTLIIIALTGILTALGVYDRIGNWGGAGSIIPITGFANSIVSPAIEHRREGVILGLCCNMFKVAGPVIVIGISASVVVGIIYLFI